MVIFNFSLYLDKHSVPF